VLLTGPEKAGDSPMFLPLMGQLCISRTRAGRPRTHPNQVRVVETIRIYRGQQGECVGDEFGNKIVPGCLVIPRNIRPLGAGIVMPVKAATVTLAPRFPAPTGGSARSAA
jgi:hypothetical protein